jgi:hypothetical protein
MTEIKQERHMCPDIGCAARCMRFLLVAKARGRMHQPPVAHLPAMPTVACGPRCLATKGANPARQPVDA